ncbi:hypothetical protein Y032_0014g2343 [Ancylostoma ceylanicum]|uniref:Uncharacterized protein n=1 Tax=Ancylostoma ceylanicum TaxID=53326 RepID=A0A016VA45_9BILA|nr:hypothetical protein Y032_0014g2343 [Ancylostoma ceylanicum]
MALASELLIQLPYPNLSSHARTMSESVTDFECCSHIRAQIKPAAHTRVRYITSERKEIGVTRYTEARRKFGLRIRDQRRKLHMVVYNPSRAASATKCPSFVRTCCVFGFIASRTYQLDGLKISVQAVISEVSLNHRTKFEL